MPSEEKITETKNSEQTSANNSGKTEKETKPAETKERKNKTSKTNYDSTDVKRLLRRTFTGIVKSDKAKQTIRVDVVRRVPHKIYKKIIKQTTKLYAHDEKEEARIGDKVLIMQTRPISKLKNWRLVKILKH